MFEPGAAAPTQTPGSAGAGASQRTSRVRFGPAAPEGDRACQCSTAPCECARHREAGSNDTAAARREKLRALHTETIERESYLARLATLRDAYREDTALLAQVEAHRAGILSEIMALTEAAAARGENRDLLVRSAAAECAAATKQTSRTLEHQLDAGHTLVTSYPHTHAVLAAGGITVQHANAITRAGEPLPTDARAGFDRDAARLAQGTSPNRLRTQLRGLAETHHPTTLQERHDREVLLREIWVRDLDHGMAELGATLSAVHAHGIYDRITRGAKAAARIAATAPTVDGDGFRMGNTSGDTAGGSSDGETADGATSDGATSSNPAGTATGASENAADPEVGPTTATVGDAENTTAAAAGETKATTTGTVLGSRTMRQLQADLFVELLLTGTLTEDTGTTAGAGLSGITPQIMLTLPADGLTDHAQLPGHGPIDPVTARQLTAAAPGWDRIGINSDEHVVTTDRYRVTEPIRRVLAARDTHCRFIGCRMPVNRCDIDHTVEWMHHGQTTITNTSHLCRAHHALKHPDVSREAKWAVIQQPDGTLVWTAPTGAEYADTPVRGYAGPTRDATTRGAGDESAQGTGDDPSRATRESSARDARESSARSEEHEPEPADGTEDGPARNTAPPGHTTPGKPAPRLDVPF